MADYFDQQEQNLGMKFHIQASQHGRHYSGMVQDKAGRHIHESSKAELVQQGIKLVVQAVDGRAIVQEMGAVHHLQERYAWDHVYHEGACDDAYWEDYCFETHQICKGQQVPERMLLPHKNHKPNA